MIRGPLAIFATYDSTDFAKEVCGELNRIAEERKEEILAKFEEIEPGFKNIDDLIGRLRTRQMRNPGSLDTEHETNLTLGEIDELYEIASLYDCNTAESKIIHEYLSDERLKPKRREDLKKLIGKLEIEPNSNKFFIQPTSLFEFRDSTFKHIVEMSAGGKDTFVINNVYTPRFTKKQINDRINYLIFIRDKLIQGNYTLDEKEKYKTLDEKENEKRGQFWSLVNYPFKLTGKYKNADEIHEEIKLITQIACDSKTISEHCLEALDLCKLLNHIALVDHITLIDPYFEWARQDKIKTRESKTLEMILDFYKTVGVESIFSIDIHNDATPGLSPIQFNNLYATAHLIRYFQNSYKDWRDYIVIAPDAGGILRADKMAEYLDKTGLVTAEKKRDVPGEVGELNLLGNVKGKKCIIRDDIIDSGTTLKKLIEKLKKDEAKDIVICATHTLMTDGCIDMFDEFYKNENKIIFGVITTNTIYRNKEFSKYYPWYKAVSLAPLIAETIYNRHMGHSIGHKFDYKDVILHGKQPKHKKNKKP